MGVLKAGVQQTPAFPLIRRSQRSKMNQRAKTNKARKGRGFTYLWIFGLAVLVFILIWRELTAVLYILATLGVTALLIVVAFADLGRGEESSELPTPLSDAQARGSGISSRVPTQPRAKIR